MLRFLRKIISSPLPVLLFHMKRKISWIINKRLYGQFGYNSIIQKPIMPILNKKCIYVGDNVVIRPQVRMEPIIKYLNATYQPKITIGSGTNIEQCCHVTCANEVVIGQNVTIAAFTMITDIDHEYSDINKGILNQKLLVKKTIIGDESFIGMGSRIMPGVTLGKHCIIGANSVVTKDIPDYSVAVGIPAKVVKRYSFEKNEWCALEEENGL